MTSSAFVDPFADTEIQAAIAHLPSFAPRAKYLGMQRGTDIVSGDDIAAPVAFTQRRHDVQQLAECEREILDVIVCLGGIASSDAIANHLECNVKTLKRNELHKLARDGFIAPVHARGWELTERGRAVL